jgi:hypothetical protein
LSPSVLKRRHTPRRRRPTSLIFQPVHFLDDVTLPQPSNDRDKVGLPSPPAEANWGHRHVWSNGAKERQRTTCHRRRGHAHHVGSAGSWLPIPYGLTSSQTIDTPAHPHYTGPQYVLTESLRSQGGAYDSPAGGRLDSTSVPEKSHASRSRRYDRYVPKTGRSDRGATDAWTGRHTRGAGWMPTAERARSRGLPRLLQLPV